MKQAVTIANLPALLADQVRKGWSAKARLAVRESGERPLARLIRHRARNPFVEGVLVSVKVLALDLERTLIDNSLSGRPRPGLLHFLTFCHTRFGRVALFTTLEEGDARDVLAELADRGHVPRELLARLEFIEWSGEYKDLAFVTGVTPSEVLLVDDDPGWVRPDQRGQWVAVVGWDGGPDSDLVRVREVLEQWTDGDTSSA